MLFLTAYLSEPLLKKQMCQEKEKIKQPQKEGLLNFNVARQ
jgi:hypothetical protein